MCVQLSVTFWMLRCGHSLRHGLTRALLSRFNLSRLMGFDKRDTGEYELDFNVREGRGSWRRRGKVS